jgi:hypothetical protein
MLFAWTTAPVVRSSAVRSSLIADVISDLQRFCPV